MKIIDQIAYYDVLADENKTLMFHDQPEVTFDSISIPKPDWHDGLLEEINK